MMKPVIALLLCAAALPAANFPEADITNGILKAKLYLPDAANGYYRATRFDWSGQANRLEYKGHTCFGEWNPRPTIRSCMRPSRAR